MHYILIQPIQPPQKVVTTSYIALSLSLYERMFYSVEKEISAGQTEPR